MSNNNDAILKAIEECKQAINILSEALGVETLNPELVTLIERDHVKNAKFKLIEVYYQRAVEAFENSNIPLLVENSSLMYKIYHYFSFNTNNNKKINAMRMDISKKHLQLVINNFINTEIIDAQELNDQLNVINSLLNNIVDDNEKLTIKNFGLTENDILEKKKFLLSNKTLIFINLFNEISNDEFKSELNTFKSNLDWKTIIYYSDFRKLKIEFGSFWKTFINEHSDDKEFLKNASLATRMLKKTSKNGHIKEELNL